MTADKPPLRFAGYEVSDILSPKIALWKSDEAIQIMENMGTRTMGFMVDMSKEDAITAAKMILTHYDIDYCSYLDEEQAA